MSAHVTRLPSNPIVRPDMLGGDGDNINGPSLIAVPKWVGGALGRYYLYFAHHRGRYIRLAYADALTGPWRIWMGGVLALSESRFVDHVASPDVIVDDDRREILMYYHGLEPSGDRQSTRLAVSSDGLTFVERAPIVAQSYLRVFRVGRWHYGLERPPGIPRLCRSVDGRAPFTAGPEILTPAVRHCAVHVRGRELSVLYTVRGDCPERILRARVTISDEDAWERWSVSAPENVLGPEFEFEGVDCPLVPSQAGPSWNRVRQLRDPAVFVEDDSTYLLYAVGGESGIAIARADCL